MIIFKNLPDTSTPLNATNLNKMQEQDKNTITASISNNYTKTIDGYEMLPLDIQVVEGSKLTLKDGSIVVGSGVSKVKISAKVSFNNNASGLKWLTIFLNSTPISANPRTLTGRDMIYATEMLIEVKKDDKISLNANGSTGDVIRGTAAYTNITVEAYS